MHQLQEQWQQQWPVLVNRSWFNEGKSTKEGRKGASASIPQLGQINGLGFPTNQPTPIFCPHHNQWEYKLVRSVSSINIRCQSLPNLDWSSSHKGKRTNKELQYIAMCNMCILSANQPASSSSRSRSWSWSSKSSKPSSPSFSYSGQNYIESCTTKWPKDPQSCCCNAVLFSPKILFCFQLKVFNLTLSNAVSWSFSKMF